MAGLALGGAEAAPYEEALANPPSLFEKMPADRAGVDTNATLVRRLKAEPTSLNPLLMFTAIDAEFDYLLWARPFVIDANMEWALNPDMAAGYQESGDHLEARLTLSPRLKWHDGQPFTADDIVFSYQMLTSEHVTARRAATEIDQLADCRAIGTDTVVYRFKRALPTNKWAVDFPIIPRHLYEPRLAEDPTLQRSDVHLYNRKAIGNGPYRLVDWIGGQRLVLERWDDCTGRKPAFKRIVFEIVPDNNAALLAFEAGDLGETELTPRQFARDTDSQRFAEVGVKGKGEQWTTYYIGWNVSGSVPFLADAQVRQALGHALNVPSIINRVFFGLFTPSTAVFPRGSWACPPDLQPYSFDLNEATRLLDAAGWTTDPNDGWRYKTIAPNGGEPQRLRAGFTLNIVQGSQTSPVVASIFQKDLRRLGVQMQWRVLEWSVFNERNFKHEFEAYLSAWTPGPEPDEARNLFHSTSRAGGRNYVGYANEKVDSLFDEARQSLSREKRQACYHEIARIIHDDAPYTFIVHAQTLWAFDKKLRGVAYSPRGPVNFFPGVLDWWQAAK